jgi:hypothetical protein
MTPYREELLESLADGEWHEERELKHRSLPPEGFEAFIRLLQLAGHTIDERESNGARQFRLRRDADT